MSLDHFRQHIRVAFENLKPYPRIMVGTFRKNDYNEAGVDLVYFDWCFDKTVKHFTIGEPFADRLILVAVPIIWCRGLNLTVNGIACTGIEDCGGYRFWYTTLPTLKTISLSF